MSRFKISFVLLVGVTALSFAGSGCNPASLSYFLFKGDGKAPALYPLKPKEGKKDVIVAVLVTGPINTIEFAGLELSSWPETGSVHDCAAAAVYLASDMSRFMTGAALHIDGGTWAAHGWKRKTSGGFTL